MNILFIHPNLFHLMLIERANKHNNIKKSYCYSDCISCNNKDNLECAHIYILNITVSHPFCMLFVVKKMFYFDGRAKRVPVADVFWVSPTLSDGSFMNYEWSLETQFFYIILLYNNPASVSSTLASLKIILLC